MEKRLFLKQELLSKGKEQTGEQLGGKYAARVQTGVEKDGSPQYRYFLTQADYQKYLAEKREAKEGGKKKDGKTKKTTDSKRLKEKLKKEQSESGRKAKNPSSKKVSGSHSKNRSMFPSHTRDIKKFSVKKSLRLYLGEEHVK